MTPIALVTGGQRGIGLAIAEALVGAGWRVAIAAEADLGSAEVTAALERLGGNARYFRHDLAEIAAAPELLEQIERALGPVTTCVANAGIASPGRGDLLDLRPENFDRVMAVNLRGNLFLVQEVARRMLALPEAPYRSITFVTSVSAELASPERADYCISKAGLSMAARAFALRLAPHGVGVFELRPGIIATDMTAPVRPTWDQRIAEGLVPAGRWGVPEDIAAAVLPIARGEMAFATGTVVAVDGGVSIPRL